MKVLIQILLLVSAAGTIILFLNVNKKEAEEKRKTIKKLIKMLKGDYVIITDFGDVPFEFSQLAINKGYYEREYVCSNCLLEANVFIKNGKKPRKLKCPQCKTTGLKLAEHYVPNLGSGFLDVG